MDIVGLAPTITFFVDIWVPDSIRARYQGWGPGREDTGGITPTLSFEDNEHLKSGIVTQTNHYKTTVKTHNKTVNNHSKNAFFKNANFVARLFFEAIFERASQKENK